MLLYMLMRDLHIFFFCLKYEICCSQYPTTERWGDGAVICLELGAYLHMAQLMPLPLTISCFSKIQIGFAFMVLAHPGSPGKRAAKCVCACVRACVRALTLLVGWQEGHLACRKLRGAGMVFCLEQVADLHIAQLMPLPLTSIDTEKCCCVQ